MSIDSPPPPAQPPRRYRDLRVRDFVLPSRILWQSSDDPGDVANAHALIDASARQVTLGSDKGCTLRYRDGAPGILLDFGVELHGGVRIMVSGTSGNGPVRLRVRFGESAAEAMSDIGGDRNATNDHAIRDQTCLVPWLGAHEIGNTGFRFVRIDLVDPGAFVLIKAVHAVYLHRDIARQGSFRCSDERLNRIWETGAYTVYLNMQDYLWDGVKRDRLVWIGDMHPETMTISAVFGSDAVVPASLDLIREETPLPEWMNGISSYSMWWVLIHQSWFRHHGDRAYLAAQQPYMSGILDQLIALVGADGTERLTGARFLDWPSSGDEPAIHAGLHSLLVMTLEAGAEIGSALGDPALERRCRAATANLRRHIPDAGDSKQAAALMALAGLGDAGELNREVMAVGGAKRMSTFYGYYVLQARARAGDYQGCLDCIREYWGAMLDLGATTFWEDFDIEWARGAGRIDELPTDGAIDVHGQYGAHCYKGFRHSLCHGWASGPTPWLSEHVLGVRIIEPGCKDIEIAPNLCDLGWAEGTFPTPFGPVRVRHERLSNGTLRTETNAPAGVRIARTPA